MYAIVVCFVVLFVLFSAIFYRSRYRAYCDLKCEGPTPLPILGNILRIATPTKLLQTMRVLMGECGGICKMSLFFTHVLIVFDCKTLGFIMNNAKFNEKGKDYDYFHPWLGKGLLTSSGEKWTKRRKLLTPAFHFKILNGFVDIFEKVGDVFLRKLETLDSQSFDAYNLVTLYTLDIICETALGTSVNAQEYPDSQYVRDVREVLNLICIRGLSSYKRVPWLYELTYDRWRFAKLVKRIHAHTNGIIDERRRAFVNFDEELMDEFGRKKKVAFLDLLLRCSLKEERLSNEDIREEVDTFMFEGHDTTSSAITFTLYELARNPAIQEKVYTELQGIYGDNIDRHSTYEDLQRMVYLEQVIKESLRLYPSVPMFSRKIREDITCDIGTIKSGTDIFICPFATHRSAEYFPNPEVFDPERFSSENVTNIKPFSYIPFSGGYRNCIGQKFAMAEIKSILSKILRRFELLPVSDFEPMVSYEIILKSYNSVYLQVRRRS